MDEGGNWVQENSAHSLPDGRTNELHLKTDIGGKNVLVAELFYYFGDTAPKLPDFLRTICHTTLGEKKLTIEQGDALIDWVKSNYKPGVNGDPINWVEHRQKSFF